MAVHYSLPIHEVGNVTVPAGTSRVRFRVQHEDHRDWNILLQRFRMGYRVQHTPNQSGNRDGLCGAFAVWMGFRELARVNGWACPPLSRLLQFLSPTNNPAYWEFVFDQAPSLPVGFAGYMDDDYLPVNWFSYQQLDMAARWLGQEFGEGTNMRIVYVTQERSRRDVHNLMMGWPTYDDTAQIIFVHHTPGNTHDGLEDHYQAIVPDPVGNVEAETGRARCDNQTRPSQSASRASNLRDYVNHGADIPRGDKLLYLNGQLRQNPVTGVTGRIGTPLQTMVIQRRLKINTSGILAHSAKKARDKYSVISWPEPGKRHSTAPTKSDDLATKLQKRLDSGSRDPSRSASPLPNPSPARSISEGAGQRTESRRRLPRSMAEPLAQNADEDSGGEQEFDGLSQVLNTVHDWRTDQQTQPYQRWTQVAPRSPYPPRHVLTNERLVDPYPEDLLDDHIANMRQHLQVAQQPAAITRNAGHRDGRSNSNTLTQAGGDRTGLRRSLRINASPEPSSSGRKRKAESEDDED